MISVDSLVFRKKDMPWRRIEDEGLLVDVDNGEVIYLDEVGTEVWERLDKKISVKEIVDHICSRFEVERSVAESDVLEFLNELIEKGVIVH